MFSKNKKKQLKKEMFSFHVAQRGKKAFRFLIFFTLIYMFYGVVTCSHILAIDSNMRV